MDESYIIGNIVQGNYMNPPLLIFRLGVEINRLLEQRGRKGLSIVLPLKREERRTKILEERFEDVLKKDPDLVLLDSYLADDIFNNMYATDDYRKDLKRFSTGYADVQERINKHFEGDFLVHTLDGKERRLNKECGIEVGRNETFRFGFDKTYSVLFGLRTEMLDAVISNEEHRKHFNKEDIKVARGIFKGIVDGANLRFLQDPTIPLNRTKLEGDILTPFHYPFPPEEDNRDLPKGLYVRLKSELDKDLKEEMIRDIAKFCKDSNLVVYTTKETIGSLASAGVDARVDSPQVVNNPNVIAQVTQVGWGTLLPAIMYGKGLITLPYLYKDDIETLLNGELFGKGGLDLIAHYNPRKDIKFSEALEYALSKVDSMKKYVTKVKDHYGSLNGLKDFVAPTIVEHMINNKVPEYLNKEPLGAKVDF